MKQVLSIVFATMFILNSINAQQRFGVKLDYGINNLEQQSKFLIGQNNSIDYKLSVEDISGTQSIGITSIFDFGNLFLQPEFVYSSYAVKYNLENFSDRRSNVSNTVIQESIKQFDIPVYAGLKFNRIRIGAGPVFHLKESISTSLHDYEGLSINPTKFSAGLQAGIGIDLDYIVFDVRYETQYNQVSDHIQYNNQPTGLKSNVQGIKVGVALVLGK